MGIFAKKKKIESSSRNNSFKLTPRGAEATKNINLFDTSESEQAGTAKDEIAMLKKDAAVESRSNKSGKNNTNSEPLLDDAGTGDNTDTDDEYVVLSSPEKNVDLSDSDDDIEADIQDQSQCGSDYLNVDTDYTEYGDNSVVNGASYLPGDDNHKNAPFKVNEILVHLKRDAETGVAGLRILLTFFAFVVLVTSIVPFFVDFDQSDSTEDFEVNEGRRLTSPQRSYSSDNGQNGEVTKASYGFINDNSTVFGDVEVTVVHIIVACIVVVLSIFIMILEAPSYGLRYARLILMNNVNVFRYTWGRGVLTMMTGVLHISQTWLLAYVSGGLLTFTGLISFMLGIHTFNKLQQLRQSLGPEDQSYLWLEFDRRDLDNDGYIDVDGFAMLMFDLGFDEDTYSSIQKFNQIVDNKDSESNCRKMSFEQFKSFWLDENIKRCTMYISQSNIQESN